MDATTSNRAADLSAGCAALLFSAALVFDLGGPDNARLVSNVAQLAAPLLAGVVALVARRTRAATETGRRSWLLLALSCWAWAGGQAIWLAFELVGASTAPFPSPADLGFLAALPLSLAALLHRPLVVATGARLRTGLDGLVIGCSLLVIAWVLGLGGSWRSGDADLLSLAVAVLYPVGNIALATMALSVVSSGQPGRRAGITLIGAGLLCHAAADSLFLWSAMGARYQTGSLPDLLWVGAYLLLLVAALRPEGRRTDAEAAPAVTGPPTVRVVLPYGAVGAAALVVFGELVATQQVDPLVMGAGLLALLLLLARQLLMLFENLHLTRALEAKLGELSAREDELRFRAFHDPLTGLANRQLFGERVEQALGRSNVTGSGVAVLFVDLDDFKTVNDSLGHPVGDELLIAVAQRLESCTRPEDLVARLGGDEFAALLESTSEAEAEAVAERMIEAMREPAKIHGREVYAHISVGLACGRPGELPERVLGNADVALYGAKEAGKATHQVFEPAMRAAVEERLELKADLQRALERRELVLSYQPIVQLATGRTVAVEALVRWDHPSRGLLAPEMFVGLAEETGLIVPIGQKVLESACEQAAAWREEFLSHPPLVISVNLSARQLHRATLVDEVRSVLQASGLDAAGLVLEITESVLMHHDEVTVDRLHELKDLGVRLAIDDFGTGYSSLNYLRVLPVDILKIDKAFTHRIGVHQEDAVLLRAIIQLGQSLGLETIAEGIERPEQVAELLALGCDRAQGYHFARPSTPAEIELHLREDHRPEPQPLSARL